MPEPLKAYVRWVDAANRRVGRAAMYGFFLMIAVLLWSSVSKAFFVPSLWTLEVAQFLMVGYYLLGGPYSLQLGTHVRMDLLYGGWRKRTKAWVDCVTLLFLLFFLGVLLYGGISSTTYAIEYGERSYSAWRPYMAPIKVVMCVAILLMLLQTVSILIRNVAHLRGEEI